jgi:hypothetical protein
VLLVLLPEKHRQHYALTVNALQTGAFAIVQNSLRESSGQTILEAMWKQKTCLGAQGCALKQLLRHAENGLLHADACDSAQIAQNLALAVTARES